MAPGERSRLTLQLLHLGKQIGYLLERRLASRGLNRTHVLVLFTLNRRPGLKALDLCGPARVEPANITRTLQSLERRNLLERRPHPTDGRASIFYLTGAGEALAQELLAEVDRLSADLFQDLDPRELPHLEGMLDALRRSVSDQLSAISPQPPAFSHHMLSTDPAEVVGEI